MHIQICILTHTHTHTLTLTLTHTHTYTYTLTHTHMFVCVCIHICTYTNIHIYIYMYKHMYIYAYDTMALLASSSCKHCVFYLPLTPWLSWPPPQASAVRVLPPLFRACSSCARCVFTCVSASHAYVVCANAKRKKRERVCSSLSHLIFVCTCSLQCQCITPVSCFV